MRAGLVMGLWFGAGAGLAELAFVGAKRAFADRLVFVPEFFWFVAPAVNAVIIGVVTMAAIACIPRRLAQARTAAVIGVPAGLAAGTVLMVPGRLHGLAVAIIAIGIGMRVGTWLGRRRHRLLRVALATLPLALVIVPAAAGLALRRRPVAPPASAPAAPGLPNILLVVLDTVRAIDLSLYGADEPTSPTLERLARQGVAFDRAMSAAPWTLTSISSMFTGRWAYELSASYDHPLAGAEPTLAEWLAGRGYLAAGFAANTEYAAVETGLAQGFHHYEDRPFTFGQVARVTGLSRLIDGRIRSLLGVPPDLPNRVRAADLNARVLDWFAGRPDRPWFVFLNYYDAHAPYIAPEAEWSRFVGADVPRRPLDTPTRSGWQADTVALFRRAYRASIAHLDAQVGRLLDSLGARGLLDNTLVIVTADHGEEFGEHGVLGHGNTLFVTGVHVPLVLAWPDRIPTNCRVGEPVTLRDLAATVTDLVGASGVFPGRSLARFWRSDGTAGDSVAVYTSVRRSRNLPSVYPVTQASLAAVQVGNIRVIAGDESDIEPMLFDHRTDPLELHDRSDEPWAQPVLARLLDSLASDGGPLHDTAPWKRPRPGRRAPAPHAGLGPPAPDRQPLPDVHQMTGGRRGESRPPASCVDEAVTNLDAGR